MKRKHTEAELRRHLASLLKTPAAQIRRDDILPVLKAAAAPSVYDKLLRRVRSVFLREGAMQHIDRQPIDWMGLKYIIRPQHVVVRHHPAVPWRAAPSLWARLDQRKLTAANSSSWSS